MYTSIYSLVVTTISARRGWPRPNRALEEQGLAQRILRQKAVSLEPFCAGSKWPTRLRTGLLKLVESPEKCPRSSARTSKGDRNLEISTQHDEISDISHPCTHLVLRPSLCLSARLVALFRKCQYLLHITEKNSLLGNEVVDMRPIFSAHSP